MFDNAIDEINAYRNKDGTYEINIHLWNTSNEPVTIKIPRASIDMSLSHNHSFNIEVELRMYGEHVAI